MPRSASSSAAAGAPRRAARGRPQLRVAWRVVRRLSGLAGREAGGGQRQSAPGWARPRGTARARAPVRRRRTARPTPRRAPRCGPVRDATPLLVPEIASALSKGGARALAARSGRARPRTRRPAPRPPRPCVVARLLRAPRGGLGGGPRARSSRRRSARALSTRSAASDAGLVTRSSRAVEGARRAPASCRAGSSASPPSCSGAPSLLVVVVSPLTDESTDTCPGVIEPSKSSPPRASASAPTVSRSRPSLRPPFAPRAISSVLSVPSRSRSLGAPSALVASGWKSAAQERGASASSESARPQTSIAIAGAVGGDATPPSRGTDPSRACPQHGDEAPLARPERRCAAPLAHAASTASRTARVRIVTTSAPSTAAALGVAVSAALCA